MMTDTGTGVHSRPVFFLRKTGNLISGNFFESMRPEQDA